MEKSENKTSVWAQLKYLWIPFAVFALFLIADVAVKQIVLNTMSTSSGAANHSYAVIPNFFYITYIRNAGMAFGLGEGGRWVFIAVTSIALPGAAWFLYYSRKEPMLLKVSLAMIISGGLGNFIDRCAWGEVVDMFEIRYFGYEVFGHTSFAVFNVADVALTIGTVMLLVYYIFFWYDKKDPKAVAKHDRKAAERAEAREARRDKRDAKEVESVDAFLVRTGVGVKDEPSAAAEELPEMQDTAQSESDGVPAAAGSSADETAEGTEDTRA